MNDFNYVARLADGVMFIIRDVRLTLNALEKDLARREAELVGLGGAYVDFVHHIERLNNIVRSMEQVTILETELERIFKVIEEQANLLKQDFL